MSALPAARYAGCLTLLAGLALTQVAPASAASSASGSWFTDPVSSADRAAEIAVPSSPEAYDGPREHTRATFRTHDGSLAVPVTWADGHQLESGQALSLSGNALFAYRKASPTKAARRQIARLGDALRTVESVRCEGYADYNGSEGIAKTLSAKRAKAICRLVKAAAPPVSTSTVGYGESRPVVVGGSGPESRPGNRRVVIVVTRTDVTPAPTPAPAPAPAPAPVLSAVSDADMNADAVTEGSAAGTATGVTAHATTTGSTPVSYRIAGDTSTGGFRIDPATGIVTVADSSRLVHSSGPQATVVVEATDGTTTRSATFTITVDAQPSTAPSTPVDSNGAPNTVVEGGADGSTVGLTASATDPRELPITYSLTGDTSGGGFAVNASTGVVTVADSARIDYESATGHAYTVTVQASNGSSTSSQTFTIAVTDAAPSTPADSDPFTPNAVAEDAPQGMYVGVTAASTDVNGPAVAYSITSDASSGGFTVNASTGVVTVNDPTKIDYESASGHYYSVTIRASDGTLSSSQTFTISVTDAAPSRPIDSDSAVNSVPANSPNGSTVGLTASSHDHNGPAVTYSLTGDTSGGGFTVNATTGVVTVADQSLLQPNNFYFVTVRASDGLLSSSQDFSVLVTSLGPQ